MALTIRRVVTAQNAQRQSIIRMVEAPVRHCSPMHCTRTSDYGVVLEGSQTLLHPCDVVVQHGTNHAWDNRSDRAARMVFILIGAEFAPERRAVVPDLVRLP